VPLYVYLGSMAIVASVALMWHAVGGVRLPTGRVRANLRGGGEASISTDLRDMQLARSAQERLFLPAMAGLARRGRRVTPAGLIEALERRITMAGASRRWPIERVLALKLVFGSIGVILGLTRFAASPSGSGFFFLLSITAIGYFAPDAILYLRSQERQEQIGRALADTLDQVTISVEAGLGFEAALAQAGRSGKGALAEELVRTLQDIQIGVPRTTALNNLLDRTDVPDLRHFVLAIKQAEQYGVPVAQVLRVQSRELREKRRQKAEERALKIPVKIVFPLVFCILPALFIVVGGPAFIRITQTLFPD